MEMNPDNRAIYDANWPSWIDMKIHGPASRWLRSLIRSQIHSISNRQTIYSILDVGCGEGTITRGLAEWLPHAQVVGIDFSKTAIEQANAKYQQANLHFIFDETSQRLAHHYDLVTAFEILEHVEKWEELLDRMANAARQFVLLSFPTGRMRPCETEIGHYRNFKPGEVERFLLERGFHALSLRYAGFPFFSPLYRDFCNWIQPAARAFVVGPYGWPKKSLSQILYFLFRFLSTQRRFGDQFCGLFARAQQSANTR
jgi:SAM-dependent methyltransferase